MQLQLFYALFLPVLALSFQQQINFVNYATVESSLQVASSDISDISTESESAEKLLQRDRYIATNRFTVRPGKGAKFEKRWATRKSRLSSLDGFRYFHLMRRVSMDGETDSGIDPVMESGGEPFGNYVSFTIWEEKKHFNAWRSGEAFKEAHGGTSISAFLGTMISSARLLKGPPRPAFYDGLLQLSNAPESVPETVDGWRKIESDSLGKQILPSECFVACNEFFIPPENAKAFESRWAERESALKENEGFVSFCLARRDAKVKGHGVAPLMEDEPTYVSTTIWKDRASFQKWRNGGDFKKAHSQPKSKDGEAKQPPKPSWTRPPQLVFYEGTLVITNEEGA